MSLAIRRPPESRSSMMPSFTEPSETRAADLRSEQAVVDAAYEHLDRMRVKVERLLAEMKGAAPTLNGH